MTERQKFLLVAAWIGGLVLSQPLMGWLPLVAGAAAVVILIAVARPGR